MRTLTRRSLLAAGGVATAGAGALVVGESSRGRRWLHAAGVVDGPDLEPPAVEAAVERAAFDSAQMGRQVHWGLAAPADPAEAIVLCLHGRGGTHRFAFDTIGVHRFVAADGLPWAVVAVDGGASSYWHERDDGTDAQAMVFDELLPVIRDRFGALPVVLLGWSMGGYGALLAAADRPGQVVSVAAASPALWRSFDDAAPGAFDDSADFAAHDLFARVAGLRRTPVRIDCGRDDPFAGAARALARELPAAESDFGAGFHEAGSWRSRIPQQLAFFRRALAG